MRCEIIKKLLTTVLTDRKRRIFSIFLVAFFIRLGLFFLLEDTPRGDAADYENIALNIINGEGFVSTRMGLYSYRPPLYPLFLAGIFTIKTSYFFVGFIQAIISSITCIIVFYIGESIFDEDSGSVASIIMALYPGLIFYSTQILSETLFVFILLLGIYVFFRDGNHYETRNKYVFLGILVGLASLCRPVIFPFLIFLIPFYFLSRKPNIKKWMLVTFFALLTIAPWTIRNYFVHHRLVLLTTYGGANLWMGNYLGATGYIGRPNNINQLVRRNDISETEKDILFYKKATSFIVENPAAFFKLSVKKFILFWNPWVDNHTGPSYIRDKNIDYKGIIAIAFSALMVFAVIGFINTSSVWKKTWLLLILLLYFSIVSMVFYVSFRYRQPIIPVLGLFAGKGIMFSFSSIKHKIRELSLERFIGVFNKE